MAPLAVHPAGRFAPGLPDLAGLPRDGRVVTPDLEVEFPAQLPVVDQPAAVQYSGTLSVEDGTVRLLLVPTAGESALEGKCLDVGEGSGDTAVIGGE